MNQLKPQPWEPADATVYLREMGRSALLSVAYKLHAKERMAERSLIVSDLLYLLKTGFVFERGVQSEKSQGHYKYSLEGVTPNSGGRKLRAVIIPNYQACTLKIITFMWVDEKATKAGTLLENDDG